MNNSIYKPNQCVQISLFEIFSPHPNTLMVYLTNRNTKKNLLR